MAQANNPNITVNASVKADMDKYAAMSQEARSAEAQRIVSFFIQTVREKGILGSIWTAEPSIMAGIKRAAELIKDADVPKEEQQESLAKKMLSTQELFNQKLLPQIEFVLRFYKGGMHDNQAQAAEADVNSLIASGTATEQDFSVMDRHLSRVQSIAFSIVLVIERLRGQLIASAIDRFSKVAGVFNKDAKKIMLRRVFNICPTTARRIINLSNMFLRYPRLMFVSATPSDFITLWNPFCKWMDDNKEETIQLMAGFGHHQLACGVVLNDTETANPKLLPKIERLQAYDRQYMPDLTGYQAHLLQPLVPPQPQPQTAQPAPATHSQPETANVQAKPKRTLKKKVAVDAMVVEGAEASVNDTEEEEGTTAFEKTLTNITTGVSAVTAK